MASGGDPADPSLVMSLQPAGRDEHWWPVALAIALLTLANLLAAVRLFHDILTDNKPFANNATGLLATSAVIWAINVIAFALWCWDLDRGRRFSISSRSTASSLGFGAAVNASAKNSAFITAHSVSVISPVGTPLRCGSAA